MFKFTPILGPVTLVETTQYPDDRGFFQELFRESQFPCRFVQVNHSFSRRGVLRGLHFQAMPVPQGKLVTVITGRIYDVAVDLRRGFKGWAGVELTPGKLLWIPPGFAHGFQALEDSHVIYFVTREFSPQHDAGVAWDDPEIGVRWPLPNPILSEKDRKLPRLAESRANFPEDPGTC
ncbi:MULTISPECIES: dTDP-4-dehydrorhamnose 3,5-epimerase [Metallosphaera]|uniref:dTDP-4-dehydrorhamnose 3,5-epimerase n=1 Tax=Metallosphaera TaxID=41980 RepID=UPI0020BE4045|nr:dTDP-4-dehydrorhamnose 3,5-epimerase [Metallosphaera sedula]BBL47998.1 dTDP-4-dehydrorhamnose 3,5-epimerase [Metallosphaera sedula]